MIHRWAQGTDGNGATVRATLYDYRKAFDLIDHDILVRKLTVLDIPKQIINWIIDFLSGRSQRIKLAKGCFSEWESVPSGVPQGTKLGPWLFLVLINDLEASSGMNAEMWKYVDDTTTSEVVIKGKASISQRIADHIMEWSSENRVQLNNDKCKELRITFSKQKQAFPPIIINGKGVETVKSAKFLGVTISDDLSWNEHVREVVKKASKRLYFLVQLKRARLPTSELVLFYCTCIRSVLSYAVPVFYYSLPLYLKTELERVQKRALAIIFPGIDYSDALVSAELPSIERYNENICKKTFNSILNDKSNRLRNLLPSAHKSSYSLRRCRRFETPR